MQDLSLHSTVQDGWVAHKGFVYDVTEFMAHHPGGRMTLTLTLALTLTLTLALTLEDE